MQIENTESCIICGSDVGDRAEKALFSKIEKPLSSQKLEHRPKRRNIRNAFSAAFFKDLTSIVRSSRKRITAAIAGLLVCTAGVSALSTYCTVGIDCYYGDRLLCTVAAADDAAAIIGDATKKAGLFGVDGLHIETSAKIALKKDIVDGSEAVDQILALSPGLCKGYAVSVDGTELFIVSDKKLIDSVLDEYVQKYKINNSATLSATIEISDRIVKNEEITPTNNIISMLEEGNILTVTNTVDLVEQETIPHDTTEIPDDTLYIGESVVETKGVNGVKVSVNENIYSNGTWVTGSVLSTKTTAAPVTEVVRVGTKLPNPLETGFAWPLSGRLSSGFGERWGRQHRGIDLAVAVGTPVAAAAAGTVIVAEYKESYGNVVQIDHGYGVVTTYAHLNSISVAKGQKVLCGQLIAYSGNTGNSTGPHLHFEIIDNGNHIDPLSHMI